MTADPFALDDFSGTARLFPLPDLVLFPQVAQPLHIFERRYRRLMADALAGDRLITMALLRPGWEEEYHNEPPIHATVCVGRIHEEERLADGRYNLLLQGLRRARVCEELDSDREYRLARVELIEEIPVRASATEEDLRRELGRGATPFFARHPRTLEQFTGLLQGAMPLGTLCDIVSYALPLETECKQRLLDEACVEARVRMLLRGLEGRGKGRTFPPTFSDN